MAVCALKLRHMLLEIIRCNFSKFSGWKCGKCDLTQNLWLNLTDGAILCGRKFYDGADTVHRFYINFFVKFSPLFL